MPDAWRVVERLSRCSRSDVDIRTTDERIREAQQWLEANNHKELVRPMSLNYMLSNIAL
jgi:hypothetical protein